MYDEFLDTFPLTTTHEYDLTVGKYTLTAIDTINNIFYSTSINDLIEKYKSITLQEIKKIKIK
jgi:hypothetical protein